MTSSTIIDSQNEMRDIRGRIVLGTIAKLNDERFCFVCTRCDGEFLSIQSYEKHINLVHQKQTVANDVKPIITTVNVRYGAFSTPATQQSTETIILSDSEYGDDDEIFLVSSDDESENDDNHTASVVFAMQNVVKKEPIFEITENDSAKVQFRVKKREPMEIPEIAHNETAKKFKLDHQRPSSSNTSNGHKPAVIVKMEIDDHTYPSSTMPTTNGCNSNGSNNGPMFSIDDDFDFEWSGSEIDLSEATTSLGVADESENVEENSEEHEKNNDENVNDHDTTIKADDTGTKCSWCPQTFGKIFDLNRHLVTCEGWLKQFVICDHCPNKKFKWNETKGIHMNKVHSNPNRSFNCNLCTRSFLTFCQMRKHSEHMHAKKPSIECHFCKDKKFLSWYERNQHVLKKHQFGEYECTMYDCGYTCKTQDELKQHNQKIHSDQVPAKY